MDEKKEYIQEIKDAMEARLLARQRVQSPRPGEDEQVSPRSQGSTEKTRSPRSASKRPPGSAEKSRSPESVGESRSPGSARKGKTPGLVEKSRSPGPPDVSRSPAISPTKPQKSAASSMASRKVTIESTVQRDERGFRYINLSTQGIPSVPKSIFTHKDVGTLNLSGNNLREIPKEICELKTLFKLDLSRNGIRCMHSQDFKGLPAEMSMLRNLEILNLSECNLPFIPPVVWQLESLQHLNISRNKINLLAPEVGNLINLKTLDAQQTSLSSLPSEIAFCQQLEEIYLWGNTIERLPETLKDLPCLKKLAINCRSFAAIVDQMEGMEELLKTGERTSGYIPPVLFELTCLKSLDLEETKINWLPETCHAKLTDFYLARNYFKKVPQMVYSIDTLQVLDLSKNQITSLPEELGTLTNLTILRANNNFFDSIPEKLCDLVNLTELSLGGNWLKQLPAQIGQLQKLKSLILDRNKINSLPESIINLCALETLDLTDNELETLPITFYNMKLKKAHCYEKYHKFGLWLHKNPLKVPPPQIWRTEDPQDIYQYLKKLQIRQTENLQLQKLMLIGEAQSGKSSLIQTMITGKSVLRVKDTDSTRIMNYTLWTTDNLVKFNIMEFAGSEIYHSLYQMFMDPKAMYLVIYNHKMITDEAYYMSVGQWLDLIAMYAPEAVVKLVGTHADKCSVTELEANEHLIRENLAAHMKKKREHLQSEIKQRKNIMMKEKDKSDQNIYKLLYKQIRKLEAMLYDNLKIEDDISVVSSNSGIYGINDLIYDLEMLAINKNLFPHAQRFIPDYWFEFRNQIKAMKGTFLTWKQVVSVGHKHQMKNELLNACMDFLVDSGDILWFANNDTLRDVVFHKPRDLVHILSFIFRHDSQNFFNLQKNKVLVHKGGFNENTYKLAKDAYQISGQASRQLLVCLWFYLHLDNDEFDTLAELLTKLDLCYIVPQPEVPPALDIFLPMMVIPTFNKDPRPDDLNDLWPALTTDLKQVTLEFILPMEVPHGLFERFACRFQGLAEVRIDWKDWVYGEVGSTKIVISKTQPTQSTHIKLMVRGKDRDMIQICASFLCQNLYNLMSECPGLIWFLSYHTENDLDVMLTEWFPQGLFEVDQLEEYKQSSKMD